MPDPSVITFSDVNTELGQTSSQIISTSNNHVRNVASAGLSGEYGFSDLRWGINFPGRQVVVNTTGPLNLNRRMYYIYPNIIVEATNAGTGARAANATLRINSSGTIEYQAVGATTNTFSRTWLTSGVNSDYTANLHITTGALTHGDTPSADLSLSTTRTWTARAVATVSGTDQTSAASGTLIIKSGGVELFRRSVTLDAYAERT